jgi:hypothetical protein
VLAAVAFVPRLADNMGRLPFIYSALIMQLIAQVGVIMADSIYLAYFMEFMLGFTFPGKSIVMYNYTMEICSPNWR